MKGLELAGLETALQAVLEEVGAALVKVHAALLIDKGLQELEFRFGELNLRSDRSHTECWRPFKRVAAFPEKGER
jgi:hypothetical protein